MHRTAEDMWGFRCWRRSHALRLSHDLQRPPKRTNDLRSCQSSLPIPYHKTGEKVGGRGKPLGRGAQMHHLPRRLRRSGKQVIHPQKKTSSILWIWIPRNHTIHEPGRRGIGIASSASQRHTGEADARPNTILRSSSGQFRPIPGQVWLE